MVEDGHRLLGQLELVHHLHLAPAAVSSWSGAGWLSRLPDMAPTLAFRLPAPHLHEAAPVAPLLSQPHATFGRWHVRRYKNVDLLLVEGPPPALFACLGLGYSRPFCSPIHVTGTKRTKPRTTSRHRAGSLVCALLPHRGVTRKDWKKERHKATYRLQASCACRCLHGTRTSSICWCFVHLQPSCPVTVHMFRGPRT